MPSRMRIAAVIVSAALVAALPFAAQAGDADKKDEPATAPAREAGSALDFKVNDIAGKEVDLSQYKGRVVVIVNTASKCGFTKQYADLEKLYRQGRDNGVVVLGFPCNDFREQDPGSDAEIAKFCKDKYDVTFPMLAKVKVKGDDASPVYKHLTATDKGHAFGGDIQWNFTKFVIDRNGRVVARFEPNVSPMDPKVLKVLNHEITRAAD